MDVRHQRNVHISKKYTAKTKSLLDRNNTSKKAEGEHGGLKRKKNNMKPPVCLNPECRENGESHYISNCSISRRRSQDRSIGRVSKDKESAYRKSEKMKTKCMSCCRNYLITSLPIIQSIIGQRSGENRSNGRSRGGCQFQPGRTADQN